MIDESVRRFAEDPGAYGAIDPRSGLERVLTDRYCVLLGAVPTFTSVSRLRLEPEEVAETIAEVRALVAGHGHRAALWWVGSSATPGDLVDILRSHGFVPDERQGWEPHAASMVLVGEPPPVPGVVARRVESLDEFRQATAISHDAFGSTDEEREAWSEIVAERYEAERSGFAARTYLAWLDGEPVAGARAVVEEDCPAVVLIAGGVLPHARGRGVYRALVRARWEDAGRRPLCTQAGALSRPILERLGFVTVSEQELLLDPATC